MKAKLLNNKGAQWLSGRVLDSRLRAPGLSLTGVTCGICSKNVNWNAKAIQCDGCDVWFHARCANISPESFKALNKTEVKWIRNHCGIPNTSTHHSIDLDDLKNQ